jgi:uncharacterized protein with HEPN domain
MKINKNIFRLEHILESIEKIEYIVKDLDYGEYLEDWIKQDAIIRNFEIIGEAIANLDDAIKDENPEVEWKLVKDMRNFLIHEYFKVDFKAVWDTINIHLPILKRQIEATLENTRRI